MGRINYPIYEMDINGQIIQMFQTTNMPFVFYSYSIVLPCSTLIFPPQLHQSPQQGVLAPLRAPLKVGIGLRGPSDMGWTRLFSCGTLRFNQWKWGLKPFKMWISWAWDIMGISWGATKQQYESIRYMAVSDKNGLIPHDSCSPSWFSEGWNQGMGYPIFRQTYNMELPSGNLT